MHLPITCLKRRWRAALLFTLCLLAFPHDMAASGFVEGTYNYMAYLSGTDQITINSTDNVQRVEIYNMQGQLVKAETGAVNNISVKDLANGMYTLKLTTDNGTSIHKIVKK